MNFQLIDINSWKRKEYFDHYHSAIPCTYSLTVKLDISGLKSSGKKLYPTLLHVITKVVNQHEEFRTAFDAQGRLGFYNIMFPCCPWESFDGFNLNLQKGYDYLLPIFTIGRFYEENGRYFIPLAIQVHHAVCDGFHVCRFISELKELIAHRF